MAFYPRERLYGAIIGGSLGVATGIDIGGKRGLCVAAIGGFYGMCWGDYWSGFFATVPFPWNNNVNATKISGFMGGMLSGISLSFVLRYIAYGIEPSFS